MVKKLGLFARLIHMHPFYWVITGLFVLTAGAIGTLSWYGYNYITTLNAQVASLQEQLELNTAALEETIAQTETTLSEALNSRIASVSQEIEHTQQQVGSVSGTVTNLEKLSKTDPELLQKYSKVFFLNEHYTPERVTTIPKQHTYYESRSYIIHERVWPYLQQLLNAANSTDRELYVISAYRGFDEQGALKNNYTVTYGEGTANQFSADQGYSEHQLGTTVDLITTGIGGDVEGFETTQEYQWLRNNAHRYGFTLSYPEDNSYYVFEPWHWRFVGVELATYLKNTGQHFYDLDQREIDEYLISIFD